MSGYSSEIPIKATSHTEFCGLCPSPSLDSSFCRLCPSLDCYLQPTVLFCLPLSVFSGTFLPSSTSGLVGDLVLRPFVWVSRQNRQIDRLSRANTNGNELLRIVSHIKGLKVYLFIYRDNHDPPFFYAYLSTSPWKYSKSPTNLRSYQSWIIINFY